MSTDNELTACRAGGVSFIAIVMPAFLLGLAVASVDLVFVNYVVPGFLQSTERAVLRDLGSLIVSQVGRQERFQYDRLMVTADSAEQLPSGKPDVSIVVLRGVAATLLDGQGNPRGTVVGQKATLVIHNLTGQDSAEIEISLENASGFNPANAFQKVSGSVTTLSPDGSPIRVPSYFKSKPKFLNWKDLITLSKNPYLFPTVADVTDRIQTAREYEEISTNILKWWETQNAKGGGRVTFDQVAMGGGGTVARNQIVLQAVQGTLNPNGPSQECLTFTGAGSTATTATAKRRGGKCRQGTRGTVDRRPSNHGLHLRCGGCRPECGPVHRVGRERVPAHARERPA